MRRFLAVVVFSLAATGATLAGSGLVTAPHIDPPGTPIFHDHVLAAYRFPIFLMRLQQFYDRGAKLSEVAPLATSLTTTVLALVTAVALVALLNWLFPESFGPRLSFVPALVLMLVIQASFALWVRR